MAKTPIKEKESQRDETRTPRFGTLEELIESRRFVSKTLKEESQDGKDEDDQCDDEPAAALGAI